MAQVIKNLDQLAKMLKPKISTTLELVEKKVKSEIDETLGEYYEEYSPIYYHRTNQLKNCCKIGKPKLHNGKVNIEVYLDINSLKYVNTGAEPYKTVVSAIAGLHGGWDTSDLSKGQVPWEKISSNLGKGFGSQEPMQELIDNEKLISMFKKHAQVCGLNLK